MNNNGSWNCECRLCGSPRAYVGAWEVECPTADCENYTEKQKKIVDKEIEAQEEAQRAYEEKSPAEEEDAEPDDTDTYDPQGLWASWGQGFPNISGGVPIPAPAVKKAALPAAPQPAGPTKDDFQDKTEEEEYDDYIYADCRSGDMSLD